MQATLEYRQRTSYMADAFDTDLRWKSPNGETWHIPDNYLKDSITFLEKQGLLQQWPKSNSFIDGQESVLAPYKLYLVSIEPKIFILEPHDFGPIANHSISEIVGPQPDQCFLDSRLLNYIEYGSEIPFASRLFWFSPELGVNLSEIDIKEDRQFSLNQAKVTLIGKNENGKWRIVRQK